MLCFQRFSLRSKSKRFWITCCDIGRRIKWRNHLLSVSSNSSLNDSIDCPSLTCSGHDSFYKDNNSFINLRQALGTQQTPPNQVLIAVALFLSFYVMSPIFDVLYVETLSPYLDGKLEMNLALSQGLGMMKEFMVSNTRVDTLNLFADMSDSGPFEDKKSIPLSIVLPAFITSELKTAFEIGFLIFLPFLVIDMVIASILMSLGMMMLSPMLISLPFKLLLFVLVDGWAMTIGSLSATFLVN